MLCVHLGPGRLGLGLIVDQLDQSRFSVCLVGRPDPGEDIKETREYGFASTDPQVGLGYRNVRWPSNAATVEGLPAEVLEIIDSAESVLITCALAKEISSRVDFIAELVARRPDGAETVLLPCENDPHEAYDQIVKCCGVRLTCCPCVVDRICSWPFTTTIDEQGRTIVTTHPRDAKRRRVVVAHPVGEWVISAPDFPLATLARLAQASLVTVVHGDIDGYEVRKRWSVNGVHTLLALVARNQGIGRLPLAGSYQDAFLESARPLLDQISAAVEHGWPDVPHDEFYVAERIRAFVEAPDTTGRILERHLVRSDLRSFMGRLNYRVGEAARAANAAGQDCEPFYQAMSLVVSVLSDYQLYYPEDDPHLDPSIDEEVLEMFVAGLQGWLDDPRAQDLSMALERALRAHHAL